MREEAESESHGELWEQRYRERPQRWSGKANAAIMEFAGSLAPGRSLDLGCGEGGDVIWLAQHGWSATGIDISPTAIERANAAAELHGVADTAKFAVADLVDWHPENERFDLVTLTFVHWQSDEQLAALLRNAALAVASGGHLLVTGHHRWPSWAGVRSSDLLWPAPKTRSVIGGSGWDDIFVGEFERDAIGPNGQAERIDDSIVLLHRRDVTA